MVEESFKIPTLSTLEKCNKILNLIHTWVRLIGVGFYEKNIFNWRLLSCITVITIDSLNSVYTLFIVRHDFVLFLKCVCAFQQALQGASKLYLFFKVRPGLRAFSDFIRNLYVINGKTTANRQRIMRDVVNHFQLLLKLIVAVCILIILVVAAYPAYSFFYLGKVELFFEVYFMGYPMSNGTVTTYIINYVVQFVELFYAYVGNILFDVVLCTISFHVYVMMELQRAAFEEAKEVIGKDHKLFQKRFRNCMIMLQDINNYISTVKSTYSPVVFVQIATGSVTMALGLFCVVKTDWFGADGFALFGFIQVFSYCLIGTFVDITYDKLVDIVYDFPWYLTSKQDQEMIGLSLNKVQTATKIMIGGFAELNVSSGTAIFKTIYSYLMMLLSFADLWIERVVNSGIMWGMQSGA